MNQLKIYLGNGIAINEILIQKVIAHRQTYSCLIFPELGSCQVEGVPYVTSKSQEEIFFETRLLVSSLEKDNICLCTNSDLFFTALRLKVADGEIKKNQVQTFFLRQDEFGLEEEEIKIIDHGGLDHYPFGCFDGMEKLYDWMLEARTKQRKQS